MKNDRPRTARTRKTLDVIEATTNVAMSDVEELDAILSSVVVEDELLEFFFVHLCSGDVLSYPAEALLSLEGGMFVVRLSDIVVAEHSVRDVYYTSYLDSCPPAAA